MAGNLVYDFSDVPAAGSLFAGGLLDRAGADGGNEYCSYFPSDGIFAGQKDGNGEKQLVYPESSDAFCHDTVFPEYQIRDFLVERGSPLYCAMDLLVLYAPKKPRVLLLLIPLAVEMGGLTVSFLSPGNTARGGEGFGFSLQRVFDTILMSFYQGVATIGDYFREKPAIFVIFLLAAIIAWEAWNSCQPKFGFAYPVLFAALMFCTWCAMFAPGIYAAVEVSGGVPNTILQTFVLTGMADIVYITGWIRRKKGKAVQDLTPFRKFSYPVFAAAVLLFLIFSRGTLKETTFFNCTSYILSGQAEDYKLQMEERMAILLDDTKKDVELPEMNSDQGPLMHMEVMEDPGAWTNMVVQQFFQKDRVVRVPRK